MDMRGAESLHKADIRAILPRMSLLPAETAPTALINGQRYILYPNTEGHTNTQLKRVGAKHMRVKRIRGIAWGIIAVALVHHLFTAVVLDTSSFWTTLVLPFIYGVTSGVQLLIHEGGADSPEADELRAFLPQSMKNYEESQQAYLNARLEYTIPELV